MYCPNCGTFIDGKIDFCTSCGAPMTQTQFTAQPETSPVQAEQAQMPDGFPDPTVLPTPEQGRIDPENLPPEPQPEQNIDISSIVEDLSSPEPEPVISKNGFTDEDMAWFTDHQTTPANQSAPQTAYTQQTPYTQQSPYPQPTSYPQQTDFPQAPYPQPIPGNPGFVPPVPVDLTPRKSNVLLGVIGAVVFSLIGCVIWVLIGSMGYISYLGALAMSLLTVTGYKLLGKKFDLAGILTCVVVVAAAVFVSNVFIDSLQMKEALDDLREEVLTDYSEVTEEDVDQALDILGLSYDGFSDIFFHFFDYADTIDAYMNSYTDTVRGAFTHDLILGYVFSAIAFLVVAIPQYKASQNK